MSACERRALPEVTGGVGIVHRLHTSVPGAILLVALAFAPWFWGCTWPLGIHVLTALLLFAMASWSLGVLLNRHVLRLPMLLLYATLFLLFQGWAMTINAQCLWDPRTGLFNPVGGHLSWLPGSVDENASREDMIRISGMLGALVLAAWLGRFRRWRLRLIWTMAATAMSIAMLGFCQRWTHATDIFWNQTRHLDFFFATYRNVTNAGEYLNVVLPLVGALVLTAFLRKSSPVGTALRVAACAFILTGSSICGSKLAPIITGINLMLFNLFNRDHLGQCLRGVSGKQVCATFLVLGLMLAVILLGAGLAVSQDRWSRLFDRDGSATIYHRWLVDRACAVATPDAGLMGFGPGTFRAVFPFYSAMLEGNLSGAWTFAHDDYAQTLLEWGAFGAAGWAAIFIGGFANVWRFWRDRAGRTEHRLLAAGLMQSLIAVSLAAAVDFPLQIASIQLYAAVVLGLAWSVNPGPAAATTPRPNQPLTDPLQGARIFLAPLQPYSTVKTRTVS